MIRDFFSTLKFDSASWHIDPSSGLSLAAPVGKPLDVCEDIDRLIRHKECPHGYSASEAVMDMTSLATSRERAAG